MPVNITFFDFLLLTETVLNPESVLSPRSPYSPPLHPTTGISQGEKM
ncbi:MAG: hypothetical protein HWQ23_03805 [Nostoc sp. JL33]|nr:hypothetical protein [Nostoc sp. JL33]